jgi:hypothetical protein
MDNTFELRKGKLVFEADKLIISDNAAYLKRTRIISATFLMLLGIFNFWNFIKNNQLHDQWSGLLIGIFGLIFFVTGLRLNVQSEIFLRDVKSMRVSRFLFKEFFMIKLVNGQTRQVAGIYNTERLEEYIKTISVPR